MRRIDTVERRSVYYKDGVKHVRIEKIPTACVEGPPEGTVSPELTGLTPDQKEQIRFLREQSKRQKA